MNTRPATNFYYLVVGWKDSHGKKRVERTIVFTNKRKAQKVFNKINLQNNNEFVTFYTISGRTAYGAPDFKNLGETKTRWGDSVNFISLM